MQRITEFVMEEWEIDFEWLRVRHYVKDNLDRTVLPDLQAVLFLIGIQELGNTGVEFTKEEKQDLMHVAVCTLFSEDGYYEFEGRDQDGWPHFKVIRPIQKMTVDDQELLLKQKIIQYFNLPKEKFGES